MAQLSTVDLALWVGAFLVAAGTVRLVLVADLYHRLIALNVAAGGSLVLLIALAARTSVPDPVLHALALTGIVITVCFTGVALVLAGRLESAGRDESAGGPEDAGDDQGGDARGKEAR